MGACFVYACGGRGPADRHPPAAGSQRVVPRRSCVYGVKPGRGHALCPAQAVVVRGGLGGLAQHPVWPEVANKVLDAYPAANYKSAFDRATVLFGDAAMTCPVRRNARWITQHGGKAYTYFFTHVWLLIELFDPTIGVCHGS